MVFILIGGAKNAILKKKTYLFTGIFSHSCPQYVCRTNVNWYFFWYETNIIKENTRIKYAKDVYQYATKYFSLSISILIFLYSLYLKFSLFLVIVFFSVSNSLDLYFTVFDFLIIFIKGWKIVSFSNLHYICKISISAVHWFILWPRYL